MIIRFTLKNEYKKYKARKRSGKSKRRCYIVIKIRPKVFTMKFKRNQGINLYTEEWGRINSFLDNLKKWDTLNGKQKENLLKDILEFKKMFSWRNLPIERKREFALEIPNVIVTRTNNNHEEVLNLKRYFEKEAI
jgi:hypothetical protein